MAMLRDGDRVTVPELGAGTVYRVAGDAIIVAVDALGGLRVQYDIQALTLEEKGNGDTLTPTVPSAAAPLTAPTPIETQGEAEPTTTIASHKPASLASHTQPELTSTQLQRRSIEALRFGLVPDEGLERITQGWDDIRRWVLQTLPHATDPNGTAGVAEVVGEYGSGKSHTMKIVREVARAEGYLTASVEVDGMMVSLSDPERLLHSLWSSLRGAGLESHTPLLDLYLRALDDGHMAPSIAPRGTDRVRDNYGTIRAVMQYGLLDEFAEELEAVLASRPETRPSEVARQLIDRGLHKLSVKLRPMIGRLVADRPFDFIEAIVGHTAVAQLAGYRGLVVTIDEFEVEHSYERYWERIEQLLDVLSKYLSGKLDQPDVPITFYFAAVGEAGHNGDARIDDLVAAGGGEIHSLKPWDGRQRTSLARRLHSLYCSAYGVESTFESTQATALARRLEQWSDEGVEIRAFIKHYIADLDRTYGPGRRA
jgi:hypothetical protein